MAQQANKSISSAPCVDCERKGCGSYHDECEKYQAFKTYREKISNSKAAANAVTIDKINGIRRMKKYCENPQKIFKSPKK